MITWQEHIEAILEHLRLLDEEGHIDHDAASWHYHHQATIAVENLDQTLKQKHSMKGIL